MKVTWLSKSSLKRIKLAYSSHKKPGFSGRFPRPCRVNGVKLRIMSFRAQREIRFKRDAIADLGRDFPSFFVEMTTLGA